MPVVTRLLILANLAVFGLELFIGDAVLVPFALWPIGRYPLAEMNATVGFHWWQLVSSGFLHAGWLHLGLNMYALYMFGADVERVLGPKRYLILYFAAMLSAAGVQLLVISLASNTGVYPTVGASGAIFGILLAFGMLFPRRTLVLLFPPIPMPAILFVILYGIVELVNGIIGTQAGVAHFAHLGGMLGSYLLMRHWRSLARKSANYPAL